MAKCDEYVSRYSVCKNCSNEVVDCGREKCPVYKAPTADVVPKSEYDAVVSAVDNSTKEFLKLHDAYQEQKAEIERLQKALDEYEETSGLKQAKAEVASEIFAEIEKVIGNKYEYYVFDNRDIEGIEQDAIIAFADAMKKTFCELKKKYTGEKYNDEVV